MNARQLAIGILVGVLSGPWASAYGDSAKAQLGLKTWTAFECATFAGMSGRADEQKRLFELGYAGSKEFLRALQANEITSKEIGSTVPVGILSSLGGPSVDFMLGRIFENATGDAYDRVVKQDDTGLELETSKWRMDEALQSIRAGNKYRSANCELIR